MSNTPVTAAPPVVSIKNLSKTYFTKAGAFQAVSDISFDVLEGEVVSVVGPSGAGKTTVLRTVAGLQGASSGDVLVDGNPVTAPPRDFAMVFQDYSRSLLPWMSVLSNVTVPLRARGIGATQAKDRAMEALASVGLEGKEKNRPLQLSGGMQQRVAIARAIACRPKLMLMDEPFASVDAQTRMDLEDLVLPLKHQFGMSILFVTHDIDESVYLSNRVVVLSPPPSTVLKIVEIPLGEERDQFGTKETHEFGELRHEIFSLIKRPGA